MQQVMRQGLLFLLAMCSTAGVAFGQAGPPVVETRTVLATDAAHPGSMAEAAVEAQIASGYHINDHHPSVDYLIPTELKLDPSKQVSVERVIYPKGEPQKFAFADEPLSVYEGSLVVGAKLKIASGLAPGVYTLKGKLAYQACNDHACLPPASAPVTLTLKVVDRSVPLKRVNANVFRNISFN
jgi:DsbC/DsbD-like thiol-disulfide interchange protein